MKTSKELQAIFDAIEKWVKVNKGQVAFIGDFVAFDEEKMKRNEEDVIKEDMVIGFGNKETLQIMIDGHRKMVKKEKDDFINW